MSFVCSQGTGLISQKKAAKEVAIKWYTIAAENGNIDAQVNLGYAYRRGEGVEQDYAKAIKWYSKAAEQGYSYAQGNLGNMYYYGLGVERDYEKAIEWYSKAAEQGYSYAQFNLGNMYRIGEGVEQDYAKAIEWYSKAAEQGNKRALNSLAWTYHLMGDYEKALPWAEKAIEARPDDPNVIDTLATVYEDLNRYKEALEQFEICLKLYEEKGNEKGKQRTIEKIKALKEKTAP